MSALTERWKDLEFHDIITALFLDPYQNWRKITYQSFTYFISDYGNCYSMPKGKYLICNYRKVYTQMYGQYSFKGKWFSAHRLVLMAFGPISPSETHEVNHIDGNAGNNHISNLEWATKSANQKHSYDLGRRVIKGADHWAFGHKYTPETRAKMSIAKTKYWANKRNT